MHDLLIEATGYVTPLIEAVGIAIVLWGTLEGLAMLAVRGWQLAARVPAAHSIASIRLSIGEKMVLGLEFFLAADVMQTIAVPSWESLGILAGVVSIRTVLVYFLDREVHK